jgi:Ca2+-binding RTX toxin-like protein
LEKYGDALKIKYNSGADSVTIGNYFGQSKNFTLIGKDGAEKELSTFVSEHGVIPEPVITKIIGTDSTDYINISSTTVTEADGGAGNDYISITVQTTGTTIDGGDGSDEIYVIGNGHTIYGGKGSDVLYLSPDYSGGGMTPARSQSTFVFKNGDGQDRFTVNGSDAILKFADTNMADIVLEKFGDCLKIKYNSGADSVLIRDYYDVESKDYSGYQESTYTLIDKNGTEKALDALITERGGVLDSTDTELIGTDYDDNLRTYENTSITVIDGSNGDDNIRADIDNVTVYGGAGNDNMSISATGTTVDGGVGNDEIYVSGLNNTIYAGAGNDIFQVNDIWSNDTNIPSQATFIFRNGDGNDKISSVSQGSPVLKFQDTSIDDIKLEKYGTSLKIKYNSGADSVMVENYYLQDNNYYMNYSNNFTIVDKDNNETSLENFVNSYGTIPVNKDTSIGIPSDDNPEKSIDNLLRTQGVLNDETVFFGTGENNENYEPTDGNDIIYTNGGWNGTVPSSLGDDSIYVTENTLIKYTLGHGDDTIYRGEGNYYDNNSLYFDYGNTDVSVEFRRLPAEGDMNDDLKVLFFNENAQKVGSLTIKGYFDNFLTESVPERQLHRLTIKQYGVEKTGLSLTDMLTDYINSGASLVPNNDKPYYNIIRINGDAVLNNSGKVDRLIFEGVNDFASLNTTLESGNLVLAYDGGTVVINGYEAGSHSVYDIRVNGEYRTLGDVSGFYYGTNGDDIFVHNTEENVIRTYNLNKGNDIVEFPETKNAYDAYENGTKIYNKAVINSVADTEPTVDTIKLNDYYANKVIFGYTEDGSGLNIKAEKDFNPTTQVNYHKYTDVTYNNFITGNTPDLSVETIDETYIINKYNGVQNIEYDVANDANRYVEIIQASSGTSQVRLKDGVQLLTNGGADLDVIASGGVIETHSTTSNDTYHIYDSNNANLRITDNGGNDTINLYNSFVGTENEWTIATSENLRLLFNVNKDGSTDNKFVLINHDYNYNNVGLIQNDARAIMSGHQMWGNNNGTIIIDAEPTGNNKVGIENVILYSTQQMQDGNGDWYYSNTKFAKVDLESWYNSVKADVQQWLNADGREYTSTAEVFEKGYNDDSNADFLSLMNVYEKSASAYLTNV